MSRPQGNVQINPHQPSHQVPAGGHIKPRAVASACNTCIWRESNSPIATMSISGPTYDLPCSHKQCSACLTLHQYTLGNQILPILCTICHVDGGFSDPRYSPSTQVDALINRPLNLTNIRDRNFLDPNSPNFAARNTCIVDADDFRAIFNAVYQLTTPDYTDILSVDPLPDHVFDALSRCIAPGLRYTTPELLEAELKIVLQDNLYHAWCQREGARYRIAAQAVVTDDRETDLRVQAKCVAGVKELHPEVGRVAGMWEGVISWTVAVLAAKWWARFG